MMAVFTDQLNRRIELPSTPQRIISLVPSQTELLYDLGLREEVVGITKFCIHPEEWFRSKTRIGGTKKYDFDKIRALKPDLIIGNKEENEKEGIEELMREFPVWMSDIYTLKDALWMIAALGALLGKNRTATNLKLEIEAGFHRLTHNTSSPESGVRAPRLKTAYFIWRNPYMTAGHDTFINEMMELCRFENVFLDRTSRYPEVSAEEIIAAKPELVLLSSEPYPFKEAHIREFREMLPGAKIKVVDGEIFSWYGSRLLKTPGYLDALRREIRSGL
jgi:ABC-type Fe3+-hydroxamate transport system substrate-binding protein